MTILWILCVTLLFGKFKCFQKNSFFLLKGIFFFFFFWLPIYQLMERKVIKLINNRFIDDWNNGWLLSWRGQEVALSRVGRGGRKTTQKQTHSDFSAFDLLVSVFRLETASGYRRRYRSQAADDLKVNESRRVWREEKRAVMRRNEQKKKRKECNYNVAASRWRRRWWSYCRRVSPSSPPQLQQQ